MSKTGKTFIYAMAIIIISIVLVSAIIAVVNMFTGSAML